MAFELPALPYAKDALAPHMSAETLEYHHGKHHQKYVDTLNGLIEGTGDESSSLEDIIAKSEGKLFNQAAQVWNHTFFWSSLSPSGGGTPTGAASDAINSSFGSYDDFASKFSEAAAGQFGSGWAWLVDSGSGLEIMTTSDADLPLKHGSKAILTLDVWEHAYYIDFRNARPNYISTYLEHLVNWDFANENLAG